MNPRKAQKVKTVHNSYAGIIQIRYSGMISALQSGTPLFYYLDQS